MDISPDLKKAYQQLLQNKSFTQKIASYTRCALQTIYNIPKTTNIECPSIYLLIINQLLSSNQSLNSIIASVQEGQQQAQLSQVCKQFMVDRKDQLGHACNAEFNHLRHVQWEMVVQQGREVWVVRLYTMGLYTPFVMRLNYQQLSILTFKVSQVMSHVAHFDIDKHNT